MFMDNYAKNTTELLDRVRSPQSTSSTTTSMVPVAPVELGLPKSVTSTQLNAQIQWELTEAILKSLDVSVYRLLNCQ